MTTPRRFTDCSHLFAEGRLLAAGKAEYPEHAALRRAAMRLGLPAVAVGTAAATASVTAAGASTASTASATSVNAATTAVADVTASVTAAAATSASATAVSASAVLSGTTSAILNVTFLKATMIGMVIGTGTIGTADLVLRSTASERAAVTPAATAHPSKKLQKTRQAPQIPAVAVARESTGIGVLSAPSESLSLSPEPTRRDSAHATRSAVRQSVPEARSRPVAIAGETMPAADVLPPSHAGTSPPDSKTHLASEVQSLDRARAAASRGDSTGALRELDDFASRRPYRLLAGEVMLVRIEALLALGHRREAAGIARQLLQLGAPAPQRARLERLAHTE